ncbi:winged helix-turn-helix transcriptional regulator [Antrihabitans cavernicola]|uniref:Helix-turn-helix transcriptional regulator n=1 Tax=Antrihabitans cavernicola TaxID=2495913 RepID=A0A5A7SHP1_9NOCA|nr:helix-turn-helix domain-containing protein [Spelaeibacter cavernicola]KAA0024879.1 helix-turn-helix transcriptional regulator [Spelaeibacter cavernicola]
MAARSYGQYCGVTTAVELVSERWALLIIRDLLVGPRRYTDLKQGLPKIPTNILSTRLKELQEGGVIRRVALPRCGLVYELTPYGHDLEPIVLALGRWGFRSMGDPKEGDVVTADSLTMALRTAFRPEFASTALDFQVRVDTVELRAKVDDATLTVVQIAPPAPPVGGSLPSDAPELSFATGPGLRHLIAGTLTAAQAVERDVVTLLKGDVELLGVFTELFRIDV